MYSTVKDYSFHGSITFDHLQFDPLPQLTAATFDGSVYYSFKKCLYVMASGGQMSETKFPHVAIRAIS